MKQEQQTFFNIKITTVDGQTQEQNYKSEKQFETLQKEAQKVNSQIEVTKQQTFVVSTAESVDEILQVTPNSDVALSYYNYGLSLAQHNVKRDLMTDDEWPGEEGAYDLLKDVQVPKERRVADPLTKSRNALRGLWAQMHPGAEPPTDDEINAVLAQFAGASQATPTAA